MGPRSDYARIDPAGPEAVTFELNGRQVTAPAGTMLVDAAWAHGVEIPIFCYEARIGAPIGACRMCLVAVEGVRGLTTACSTPVVADMVVRTDTPEVKAAQDGVLELLLANHPLDCPVCDKGGECPLQDRTFRFGPGRTRFIEPKRHFPKPLDLSPVIALDRERCIACFRCVRFSQDVAQDRNLYWQERGPRSQISTETGEPYEGRFTGNVIDLCPVGALTSIPYRFIARPWDIFNAPSVCHHCPVGCNTELSMREGRLMRVTGRPEPNPAVEEGWLCDRGRFAHGGEAAAAPARLKGPALREGSPARGIDLGSAVAAAAHRLRGARRPAVLVGPDATVEEGHLALALATRMGAPIARLGIPGQALAGLRALDRAQLGDLDAADLVMVVGGDPANQQPVVELRVRKARRRGVPVVTAGPRPTALDALAEVVRTPPGRLAEGMAAVGRLLEGAAAPVVLWDEADLAAEPDAASALARLLEAHPHARQLELTTDVNGAGLRALGIPADLVLADALDSRIDALLCVHADPLTAPGATRWARALERVATVVAIAVHDSPITRRAAVVLPAASRYEDEGVLVSMAGRAQRLRPGARPAAGTAGGWEILAALALELGAETTPRSPREAFRDAAAAHPAFFGLSHESLGVGGQPIGMPHPSQEEGVGGRVEPEGEGLVLVATTEAFGDAASWRSTALAPWRTGAWVGLNPAEAERLGLADAARVEVASPEGRCTMPLRLDPAFCEGGAFVALGPAGSGAEALLPPDRRAVRVTLTRAA